jgi:hypothetical protein
LLGHDPFGSVLNPLKSRTVDSKQITIRLYRHRDGDLLACNVLFIAGSESTNTKSILASLKRKPVLTVSDIEGSSDEGGIVEVRPEEDKIGIWIDLFAVREFGIFISSKLLSLSHISGYRSCGGFV